MGARWYIGLIFLVILLSVFHYIVSAIDKKSLANQVPIVEPVISEKESKFEIGEIAFSRIDKKPIGIITKKFKYDKNWIYMIRNLLPSGVVYYDGILENEIVKKEMSFDFDYHKMEYEKVGVE